MKKLPANSFVLFLPFLALYVLLILVGHKDLMEGDEPRYFMYAQNLMHGFYSPREEVFLWNGPGYPLLLVPFIAAGMPLVGLTLLNALFQYISVVYLFKSLSLFTRQRTSLAFTVFWGMYYVAFKEMLGLFTEPLANMLVCLFIYHVSLAFVRPEKKRANLLIAGLLFGYLTLTKIIFGYVLLAMLFIIVFVWLFKRNDWSRKALMVALIAMLVNVPYLLYTWSLTGKYFYWANSGGTSIYWMSTPVEGEYGDWNDSHFMAYCGYDSTMPCNAALFAKNHQADYDSFYKYTGVQRDEAFRKKAIQNIRQYPVKYIKNCVANAGRLFFGMPFSYNYQRMQNLWRIPPGAVILLMFLFSLVITFSNVGRMPSVFWLFVTILLLYLGASIAVSAYQRLLTVAVPLIIIWCAYVADKTLDFRLRISQEL